MNSCNIVDFRQKSVCMINSVFVINRINSLWHHLFRADLFRKSFDLTFFEKSQAKLSNDFDFFKIKKKSKSWLWLLGKIRKSQSHDFDFFWKTGKVKVMTLTFFIFRRKSAENGQSQIDFGQNLLDFSVKEYLRLMV